MRFDTTNLEAVVQNSDAHFCGMYHDVAFLRIEEIAIHTRNGVDLEETELGTLRPFCSQLAGKTPSIGCPHSPELRAELQTLLEYIRLKRVEVQRCTDLLEQLADTNEVLHPETGIDAHLNDARDDGDTVTIRSIQQTHHSCVQVLLKITREALSICDEYEL